MSAWLAKLAITGLLSSVESASAYPIDCAILLCMAGGFPASAECSAARAEVIRRITPWPVEPPLQLWRCPMGGTGSGRPVGDAGSVPPEIAVYRDAIEVWGISKYVTTGSGGRDLYITTTMGTYDPSGRFIPRKVSEDTLPPWLEATIRARTGSALHNPYGPGFRAIVLRMLDYTGAYTTEWVGY